MNRFVVKRLSRNIQQHFHEINPLEIKVEEEISNGRVMSQELKNIIEIRSESTYYLYGKRDNKNYKNENSLGDLCNLKNSTFKKKRADLSILEVRENELIAHIIEMKATLDLDTFKSARQQLLNSLIDVELIALIALNSSIQIQPKFYIVHDREKVETFKRVSNTSLLSNTVRLSRDKAKVEDINYLLSKEYESNEVISDMDINEFRDREKYKFENNTSCKKINFHKLLLN